MSDAPIFRVAALYEALSDVHALLVSHAEIPGCDQLPEDPDRHEGFNRAWRLLNIAQKRAGDALLADDAAQERGRQ